MAQEPTQIAVPELRKQLLKYVSRMNEIDYDKSKHLLGRILTIVDSAIPDPEQRKATKDLVNNAWYPGQYITGKSETELLCESLGFELYTQTGASLDPLSEWNPYKEQ